MSFKEHAEERKQRLKELSQRKRKKNEKEENEEDKYDEFGKLKPCFHENIEVFIENDIDERLDDLPDSNPRSPCITCSPILVNTELEDVNNSCEDNRFSQENEYNISDRYSSKDGNIEKGDASYKYDSSGRIKPCFGPLSQFIENDLPEDSAVIEFQRRIRDKVRPFVRRTSSSTATSLAMAVSTDFLDSSNRRETNVRFKNDSLAMHSSSESLYCPSQREKQISSNQAPFRILVRFNEISCWIPCSPHNNFQWLKQEAKSRFLKQGKQISIKYFQLAKSLLSDEDKIGDLLANSECVDIVEDCVECVDTDMQTKFERFCQMENISSPNPNILDRLRNLHSGDFRDLPLKPVEFSIILRCLSSLSSIISLNFSNCRLDDSSISILSQFIGEFKCLEQLDLSRNHITGESSSKLFISLRMLHSLEYLELSFTYLGDTSSLEIAKFFEKCTKLTYLGLKSILLTWRGLYDLFSALSELRTLRTLDLSCNQLMADSDEHMNIGSRKAEEEFQCTRRCESVFFRLVEALPRSLQNLDLSSVMIDSSASFENLLLSGNYSELYKLHLGGNQIGDIGTRSIAVSLKINESLQVLDIRHAGITCDGCEALAAALKVNVLLKVLILKGNSLGYGVVHIGETLKSGNSTLEYLDISSCELLSTELVGFLQCLTLNRSLACLNIAFNELIPKEALCNLHIKEICNTSPCSSAILVNDNDNDNDNNNNNNNNVAKGSKTANLTSSISSLEFLDLLKTVFSSSELRYINLSGKQMIASEELRQNLYLQWKLHSTKSSHYENDIYSPFYTFTLGEYSLYSGERRIQ